MAEGVTITRQLTIGKDAAEVYEFWRALENLPRFMQHLKEVKVTGPGRSHWVAVGPMDASISWDAEITEERENALLAWRSLPGSQITTSGSVRFLPAPGGRGTELHVTLSYEPPAGKLGQLIAGLLGEEPHIQLAKDLKRFQQLIETGETATTTGQPHGKRSLVGKLLSRGS